MAITIKDIKELVSREQIPSNAEVTATMFGGQADLYIGTIITVEGPYINLNYCSKDNPTILTIGDLLKVIENRVVTIPSMDDDFNEIMEPATDMDYIPDSGTLNLYISSRTYQAQRYLQEINSLTENPEIYFTNDSDLDSLAKARDYIKAFIQKQILTSK